MSHASPAPRTWQLRRTLWELPAAGVIMGILNTTPDSFSDGGLHHSPEAAISHAEEMLRAGAHIIDIGGESTRPGAEPTDIATEMERTIPVIRVLRERYPELLISIDTRHAEVAAAALDAGADIINDISALTDPAMMQLCAERPCGIIIMHSLPFDAELPLPEAMPQIVHDFFEERIRAAEHCGISAARICLDPGIGFGKKAAHTMELIRHLEHTRVHNRPILMALSRKRFIGELLHGVPAPISDPLPTVILSLLSALQGADLHRVHDVRELRDGLQLLAAFRAK